MTRKSKSVAGPPTLLVDSEVVRRIRQHARSCSKTEVCGVLIGQDREGVVEVEASITGLNAEEAGAHVTLTQDTWEHIYKVKDKEYPDHRIVGWYHSHPGRFLLCF
jgi:proteasome lid subunit RPN8/RPN11